MRIFALETDTDVLKQEFLMQGEQEVLITFYHWFSFLIAIARDIVATVILIGVGVGAVLFGSAPLSWTIGIIGAIWFVFVFFHLLRGYIDWAYDCILVTTDKIIFVDQGSIFRREIRPINVESVGGVSTKTQFWNVFPFGIVSIYLKEGVGGGTVEKKYIPHAEKVASIVSDVVTKYQRFDHMPEGEGGAGGVKR